MTAKQEKQTVLVSPDGAREWTPEDAVQATNLRAQGWSVKADAPAEKPASKPATTTTK